jgi:hypothetical protein
MYKRAMAFGPDDEPFEVPHREREEDKENQDFKHCRCCGIKYDQFQWERLYLLGQTSFGNETIEWRNCPCGTTLTTKKQS